MKNGKKPTKKQQMDMQSAGLKPSDWLVAKNLPGELLLVHRFTGQSKTVWL